jgi:uncharacterized membrane protein YhhN
MNSRNYFLFFGIINSIYLILTVFKLDDITWYMKPFLIPFLILAVIKKEFFQTKKWLLLALLFSWIGDVILLFSERDELFFIFGLLFFLVAHILFIILFVKQPSVINHKNSNWFWFGLGIIALYLFGMLSLLIPKLGSLTIPVSVYASTISIMLIEALKGIFNWKGDARKTVLVGAFFFVVSDSILAINKFYCLLPMVSFTIMSTYLIAQYCITAGILKLNEKN